MDTLVLSVIWIHHVTYLSESFISCRLHHISIKNICLTHQWAESNSEMQIPLSSFVWHITKLNHLNMIQSFNFRAQVTFTYSMIQALGSNMLVGQHIVTWNGKNKPNLNLNTIFYEPIIHTCACVIVKCFFIIVFLMFYLQKCYLNTFFASLKQIWPYFFCFWTDPTFVNTSLIDTTAKD